ncbi:MAG: sulfite oxidase [Desulfobacterales bacterium]
MVSRLRILSDRPLNAETPPEHLLSWITAHRVFFARNQGAIPRRKADLRRWRLSVEGEVERPLRLAMEELLRLPRAIAAGTLECSGNGRALLAERASGNPWTVGGVGNAVWGGIWLREVLAAAGLKPTAAHVAFQGLDRPLGAAGVPFIRSIPLEKALSSTLLAWEMNGEPLPLEHGFPLRALALGWTGANSVKWLKRIVVLERPWAGFFMDRVYRVFRKGEDPASGEPVTAMPLKAVILRPRPGDALPAGVPFPVLGAAWAGEAEVEAVEVSCDGGQSWLPAELLGPRARFAWRHWQLPWVPRERGPTRILARARDNTGRRQPDRASWNVLGYGNNGVEEHGVTVTVG